MPPTAAPSAEVTPALIAAMLKAESDFDPDLRSPDDGRVRHRAVDARRCSSTGRSTSTEAGLGVLGPPTRSRTGKVPLLGGRAQRHIPGDPALVLAAVYRGGGDNVRAVNGIPPTIQPYIDEVARYIEEYTDRRRVDRWTA